MKHYGELGLEFKSGLIFSIIAFVLSIVAGFVGSVPVGMIIFRSLFVVPLFFLVGFGVFIILKKFVPEVYEEILNFNRTTGDDAAEDIVENVDISFNDTEGIASGYSENGEGNFAEFKEDDYGKVHTANIDNAFGTSDGKLGKHIIIEKHLSGYEPKVMAEAIRTMMSKDKD
jgi:hypothetical protein